MRGGGGGRERGRESGDLPHTHARVQPNTHIPASGCSTETGGRWGEGGGAGGGGGGGVSSHSQVSPTLRVVVGRGGGGCAFVSTNIARKFYSQEFIS